MDALLDDTFQRAGLDHLAEHIALDDARAALVAGTRCMTRIWAAEHALFQRLLGLGLIDPDVRAIITRRDAVRLDAMQQLAQRLSEQDCLRAGWAVGRTARLLTIVSGFAIFDAMSNASELAPTEAADRLLRFSSVAVTAVPDSPTHV